MRFRAPSGVFVTLAHKTQQDLFKLCRGAHPLETGGIVYGRYSDDGLTATIEGITEQPADSRSGKAWFQRGIAQLQELLNKLWLKNSYYLGEWHFHPDGLAEPSQQDLYSLASIATSPSKQCLTPIMLIVGGSQIELDYKLFIVKSRLEYVEICRLDK